jgi:hypothetical protein
MHPSSFRAWVQFLTCDRNYAALSTLTPRLLETWESLRQLREPFPLDTR